jgi:hypothetical protein
MALAVGFGGLLASESNTEQPPVEEAVASHNEPADPLSILSGLGFLATAGSAYTERKLFKKSVNGTIRKFRDGQNIPDGGAYNLKIVAAANGDEGFIRTPSYSGARTVNSDPYSGLPSVSGWLSGLLAERTLFSSLEDSVRVGAGIAATATIAGTIFIERSLQSDLTLIEQDALQRIDQLDPNHSTD